jgi:hypothetical protein
VSHYTFKSTALSFHKPYIHLCPVSLHGLKQMASSGLLFTCSTVFFFFFLSFFLSPSNAFSSYPNDDNRPKISAVGFQKVNLSLYYDTLCPSCATFIVKNLAGVFDKDLITITNLRLVPWGNSFVNKSNNGIVCQVRFSYPFGFFFFVFSIFCMSNLIKQRLQSHLCQ